MVIYIFKPKTISLNEKNRFINPVYILNQYALISTIENDIIFRNKNQLDPLFCCGVVKKFGQSVHNIKENEVVSYISKNLDLNIILPSNLIFKMKEYNPKLISILPYASYGMKILRETNPKLSQNLLIFGFNMFSFLLSKILVKSGANIHILKLSNNNYSYDLEKEKDIDVINIDDYIQNQINKIRIDKIILMTDLNQIILEAVIHLHNKFESLEIFDIGVNHQKKKEQGKIKINQISRYNIDFINSNYKKSVYYPYDYMRWDYKRNLQYFIQLIEQNKIVLDFINPMQVNVKNLDELKEQIPHIMDKIPGKLILFKLQN